MTSEELANHIQSIECKYASFTNKLSLALQYGASNLECLQNTAFVVKSNLDILKKFYSDGKICTECSIITGSSLFVTSCCTADPNSFYPDIPTAYTCYYIFNNSGDVGETIINSNIVFGISTITSTKPNGDVTTIPYTYDSSNSTITIIGLLTAATPSVFTYIPNSDCSSASLVLTTESSDENFHGITYELNGTLSGISTTDCDWAEYCITEAEAEDLIKICYKKLSDNCNC